MLTYDLRTAAAKPVLRVSTKNPRVFTGVNCVHDGEKSSHVFAEREDGVITCFNAGTMMAGKMAQKSHVNMEVDKKAWGAAKDAHCSESMGAFAFSKGKILLFDPSDLNEKGERGISLGVGGDSLTGVVVTPNKLYAHDRTNVYEVQNTHTASAPQYQVTDRFNVTHPIDKLSVRNGVLYVTDVNGVFRRVDRRMDVN